METEDIKDVELAETLQDPEETEQIEESTEESAKEVEKPEAPVQETQSSMQEVRFKTLREAREKAERERDELMRRLEALEKQSHQQQTQQQESVEYSVGPDDLVEGKHLSKYDRDIKKLHKELQEYRQQLQTTSVETRLKMQYPDFDSIVNKENMEVLRAAHPEIAATIASGADLYAQAVSAYTLIRKLGIVADDKTLLAAHRVAKNTAKPVPTSSTHKSPTSDSPLATANAFAEEMTPELKKQIYEEMQRYARSG